MLHLDDAKVPDLFLKTFFACFISGFCQYIDFSLMLQWPFLFK